MEDCNFWADILDTYHSLAGWAQVLWLVLPPALILVALYNVVQMICIVRSVLPPGKPAGRQPEGGAGGRTP